MLKKGNNILSLNFTLQEQMILQPFLPKLNNFSEEVINYYSNKLPIMFDIFLKLEYQNNIINYTIGGIAISNKKDLSQLKFCIWRTFLCSIEDNNLINTNSIRLLSIIYHDD